MNEKVAALDYHEYPQPGKLSIRATKPCETAHDLSLAYSPGVAVPCLEIAEDRSKVYRYTAKGNLVAVISNGTAVLGLGDIGPEASKPVMEGKAVLFKTFADIDVFDIELNARTVDQFVQAVEAMAPTFGGINLEDIKAPECFEIETELRKRLDIPVFHDDQHGTAIIAGAAFLNALELNGKSAESVKVVISGAGAAALSCGRLLFNLGVKRENLLLVDSKGVVYRGRTEGMNKFKADFVSDSKARTLVEALHGADVFFGLSAAGLMTPEMLLSMAKDPIVFAMANPDPEIDYDVAKATRSDVLMATGRSDFPNQVNNVLGFPFIFRGALDVRAKTINEEMKMAAVFALAKLAKEQVPQNVRAAYGNSEFSFGPEYLIPKPFDPRVLYWVAPAVAKAAMETGVAQAPVDLEAYELRLKAKQNHGRVILSRYYALARSSERRRIVFPEGGNPKVLTAASMAEREGIAEPILLGDPEIIRREAARLDLDISKMEIITPVADSHYPAFQRAYYEARGRRGVTATEARRMMRSEHYFGSMMLAQGLAHGMVCGVDHSFADMVRPILEIVGLKDGASTAAALYLVSMNDTVYFFADTAINVDMTAEKLASIAVMAAEFAVSMNINPRVAMLSYSSFGSVKHPAATMVADAVKLVHARAPELVCDGEMQVDVALEQSIQQDTYPFCALKGQANVLVFPDMQSGNISYKLLQRIAGARVVGPILLGIKSPAYVMQRHASVDEIFNVITVAVGQASLVSGLR